MTTDAPMTAQAGTKRRRSDLPPRHLSLESRRLWAAILGQYELESHHRTVLTVTLEALDRVRHAQHAIEVDGPFLEDRFGQKRSHPALRAEADARTAFYRGIRELGLDLEPSSSPRLPTRWRS